MITKVLALKLKFNTHSLPLTRVDLALRLTIREACLHRLNQIAKLSRHHPEKENDSAFVHWLVAEATKIDGISVGRAIFQL